MRDYGRIEPRQIDPRRRKLIWQGIDAPRDANVTMFDIAGINPDRLITDILNAKDMNTRRLLWDNAVETMNQALVNEFLNVEIDLLARYLVNYQKRKFNEDENIKN